MVHGHGRSLDAGRIQVPADPGPQRFRSRISMLRYDPFVSDPDPVFCGQSPKRAASQVLCLSWKHRNDKLCSLYDPHCCRHRGLYRNHACKSRNPGDHRCHNICTPFPIYTHRKNKTDRLLLIGLLAAILCIAVETTSVYFVTLMSGLFVGAGMLILLFCQYCKSHQKCPGYRTETPAKRNPQKPGTE